MAFACITAATLLAADASAQRTRLPAPTVTEDAVTLHGSTFRIVTYHTGHVAARRLGAPGTRRPAVLPPRTAPPAAVSQAAPLVLLNLHDDENTSVSAALLALRSVRARLVELRHTGARNLSIVRGAERFEIDPNRMFTDAGAAASMARLSRAEPEMVRAVRAFADTLLVRAGVAEAQTVITLHNNTDGNYSVRSYLAGGVYASDAEAVHLADGQDDDDFFFVTDRPLYDAFAREGFHVVLQNNSTVTDDGSLSVLAARRGQRYVNVEAQHGRVASQQRMIRALVRVLGP